MTLNDNAAQQDKAPASHCWCSLHRFEYICVQDSHCHRKVHFINGYSGLCGLEITKDCSSRHRSGASSPTSLITLQEVFAIALGYSSLVREIDLRR